MIVIGNIIDSVRWMTKEEMEKEGWEGYPRGTVIELIGEGKIFASRDDEGNGPGALFGEAPDGTSLRVMPEKPHPQD